MSNDYDPNDPAQVAEYDDKVRQLREKEHQERQEKAQVFTDRQKAPIIDATKPGTGIWQCPYCGQAYLMENDFKRFQCVNGCPGRMNKVDNFKRPAADVVRRIRGEL